MMIAGVSPKEILDDEIEDFKKVITASQGIPDPKVEDLINRWSEAKSAFVEMMGGELIHTFPGTFSFDLSQEERRQRFADFKNLCLWKYNNDDLANFLEFCEDGFYNNMTPRDYDRGGIKVQKGSKIVKAFKFFEPNKDVLHELQSAASRIIQEDKVTGQLCVSVHPLDFLSSSENVHNWRSCHALDGDYRAGNLSYMVDKCTFICYLRSEQDVYLPAFGDEVKWNSKKWRVLMYLTENMEMMFAGRQYPFSSDVGLNLLKDKISNLFNISFEKDSWHEPITKGVFDNGEIINLGDNYIPIRHRIKSIHDIVLDCPHPLHYNDLLKSSCYTPKYTYRLTKYFREARDLAYGDVHMRVGGPVKCLCCEETDISCSETMMCNDCECEYGTEINDDFYYCDCCGRRFYYPDGEVIHNGNTIICNNCYENEVQRCDYCGQLCFSSEITFNRDEERYICDYCKEMD